MSDLNLAINTGEDAGNTAPEIRAENNPSAPTATADGMPTVKMVQRLARELQDAIGQAGEWYRDMKLSDDRRWCIWFGQTDSGVKEMVEGVTEPEPWEGASDTRIRLVDEKVREADRKCAAAFDRGRWKLGGFRDQSARLAGKTTQLLKWMWYSQMEEEADREAKLARDWRNSYGLAFTFVEWHRQEALEAVQLDAHKLAEMIGLSHVTAAAQGDVPGWIQKTEMAASAPQPAAQTPTQLQQQQQTVALLRQVKDAWDLLNNPAREDEFVEQLQKAFPEATPKRLKQAARDLRKDGKATLPQPITLENRPRIRALKPFIHAFFPTATTNVMNAEWFAVREWLTETQLEEKANQGWDPKFIEAAKGTKGKPTSTPAIEEKGLTTLDTKDMIEVFHFFHRECDEDGVPGLYRTTISLHLQGSNQPEEAALFAQHELYGAARMKMPFVAHEFFTESERLIDQRGIPYLIHTYQNEKKNARDMRIDLSTISILPQAIRHVSDLDRGAKVKPNTPIYESVVGSFRWAEPPHGRADLGMETEAAVDRDVNRLLGSPDANIPAPLIQLHDDVLTGDYTKEMARVLSRMLELMQQYLEPVTVTRVTGEFPQAFPMSADEIRGDFDLRLIFDARELDSDFVMKKFDMLGKIAAYDKTGILDYNQIITAMLNNLDPSWADEFIRSSDTATKQEIKAAMDAIGYVMTGQQPELLDSRTPGVNWQLRLNTLLGAIQKSPVIQQAIRENPVIAKLFQTLQQNYEQGVAQANNAQIGRTGAAPAL
ncbi:MAG TPA: hypothetical protein VHC95_07000 [Opitutales bacterium]|nr:hypothetical protein [Opitutales bacterium]